MGLTLPKIATRSRFEASGVRRSCLFVAVPSPIAGLMLQWLSIKSDRLKLMSLIVAVTSCVNDSDAGRHAKPPGRATARPRSTLAGAGDAEGVEVGDGEGVGDIVGTGKGSESSLE